VFSFPAIVATATAIEKHLLDNRASQVLCYYELIVVLL